MRRIEEYLAQVKTKLLDREDIYNKLANIIRNFESQNISVFQFTERISDLLKEFPDLEKFEVFLPPAYCKSVFLADVIDDLTSSNTVNKLENIHPDFTEELQKNWTTTWDFSCEEIKRWIDAGLAPYDAEFAAFLRNNNYELNLSNNNLFKWKKEYSDNLERWKNIHPDFNYKLQLRWEKEKFTYEQCKEWIDSGINPKDYEYCSYLRDLKNQERETEIFGKDWKLSEEVIKQIKKFESSYTPNLFYYKGMKPKQELFLGKLIPDKELRERYKKYGLCAECDQPNNEILWCKSCKSKHFQDDFNNWASGNSTIDKFIQKSQLEATNGNQILEWIPYENFTDIKYLAEGGFGKVYRATWNTGYINGQWDIKKIKWQRIKSYPNGYVALKVLNNSLNITKEFLQEIIHHKLLYAYSLSSNNSIVNCYGISRDLETGNHVMVMEYMSKGNLRKCLNKSSFTPERKFYQLAHIISGLNKIHKKKLVHRDFHPGNILGGNDTYSITDLGLCQPANKENDCKVYGVLPYVAPEVLRGKTYTQASDIYAFGMIAYEVISDNPPYHDIAHDEFLAIKICQGLRPELDSIMLPKLLKDLIKRCWDAEPLKRPTTNELYDNLEIWHNEIRDKKNTEFYLQFKEFEELNRTAVSIANERDNERSLKFHPQAIYTSRLLNFKNLPKSQNSKKINEQFWGSQQNNISQPVEFPLTKLQEELEKMKIDNNMQFSQPLEFSTTELNQLNWEELTKQPTNWQTLHPNFTPNLIQSWQNLNFTYQQTQEWINVGLSPNDYNFASYLHHQLHLTPEDVLNHHQEQTLREEYHQLQPPK